MKYVLKALDECATRLATLWKKLKKGEKLGKRDINNIEWCVKKLQVTRKALEIDLLPPKPRTITEAIAYVTGKTKDGTFIALLTEKKILIKTMYITKDILETIPEFEVTVTPIEMQMNKIELSIPSITVIAKDGTEGTFLKAIPKKAVSFVVISKNGEIVKVLKK